MTVQVGDDDFAPDFTWPYQVDAIRHRLDRAGRRDHLPRIADLPEKDGDLFALLQELDVGVRLDVQS